MSLIENCKRSFTATEHDKTFLMYDLDVDGVLNRLSCIPKVTLLVTNPCIEYWFLLHNQDCTFEMDSKTCIKRLESVSANYKKGQLNAFDMMLLNNGEDTAIMRAKKTLSPNNPSTTVFLLVEALRDVR